LNSQLTYKKVILVESQYRTGGHSPHKVVADDYSFYVLKLPKTQADVISIQKEVICHALLKEWNVSTPDFLWLQIPEELIEGELKNGKLLPYHFGSSFIENSIDLSSLFSFDKKVNSREVENLDDLFLIALFDIWVQNDDRKPSNNNLLISPLGAALQLVAIDHAYTFSSMNFTDLNPDYGDGFSFNDSILFAPAGKALVRQTKVDAAWFTTLREKFYLCIEQCKIKFPEISQLFPPEIQIDQTNEEALGHFLFNEDRNTLVFQLFCSIIKDIKK
jgi:hypothetical protein